MLRVIGKISFGLSTCVALIWWFLAAVAILVFRADSKGDHFMLAAGICTIAVGVFHVVPYYRISNRKLLVLIGFASVLVAASERELFISGHQLGAGLFTEMNASPPKLIDGWVSCFLPVVSIIITLLAKKRPNHCEPRKCR